MEMYQRLSDWFAVVSTVAGMHLQGQPTTCRVGSNEVLTYEVLKLKCVWVDSLYKRTDAGIR